MTDTAFSLNEDQRAIQDMTLGFTRDQITPHALVWDRDKHLPRDVLKKAAELGMGGVYVKSDVGGSSLSRLDAAIIFEALATGCSAISSYLSIHNMVNWMIDRFGSEEQRATHCPPLCSMDKISAYCLTESGCGSDAASLKTKAELKGDHYIINGTKQFISGGGVADIYLVMARTGSEGAGGISAFIVPSDAEGLSFGPEEHKMGWNAQPTTALIFDNMRVPKENLLGNEGEGFKIAMAGLDGGRLNIGACSLGGATIALEKSLQYMSERTAFGKKLNEFQGLQFELAAMKTELEACRLLLYTAASKYDCEDAEKTMWCAMAKLHTTDKCFDIVDKALQLHGGYGYLTEYGIEKILRDLRVHRILEGTNEIMRLIISRHMISAYKD